MIKKLVLYSALVLVFYLLFLLQISTLVLFIGLASSLFALESITAKQQSFYKEPHNEFIEPLFNKSPAMIVKIHTANWSILEINEILSLTLNLTHPYEIVGKPILDLFTKSETKKIKKALRTLQKKNILHQLSSQIYTADKNKIQVTLDAAISTKDPNTAFIYITNISGIKKIESKLEENKNLLQNIIDNTLEAVIITNQEGKIIEWNLQAAKLIGQHRNNIINKSISTIINNPNETSIFLKKDINSFLSKSSTKYIGKRQRFTIINTANVHIPIELCCFPASSDNNYIFCFFLHDISKEINARSKEIRLATIVTQTEDAIISLDSNFNISSWNKGAENIFNSYKKEAIGNSIYEFLSKSHSNLLSKSLEKITKESENIKYEFSIKNKSNQESYFMANINKIKYSKTSFGISMIVRNITELKQNEIKMKELMHELELSNNELQSFAYIASHDIKEPLQGIKNYAVILKDDYSKNLDEPGVGFLDSLMKNCDRLRKLLDSLLHYSRVGNLELELIDIDTNQVINEVKDAIHHMLKRKNATIQIKPPLPHVLADPSRLSEIFTNLITNGLKYNDKSKPTIEIGFCPKNSANNKACLYVKDNGIGIEKDKVNSIFQIFQRLHKKEQYGGGAGAGLTITKRIIERHHGKIWVESELGKGTTFYFTLLQGEKMISENFHEEKVLLKNSKKENSDATDKNIIDR